MNIFVTNQNPYDAARDHCDKHVVKMILEYGQMLSTAHRLFDGKLVVAEDPLNRRKPKKFWLFEGETPRIEEVDNDGVIGYKWVVDNAVCYQVAHANHPCSVWVRETDTNYHWLRMLFSALMVEYTRRYRKDHSAEKIEEFLCVSPRGIPRGQQTPFAQAMPEEFKHEDAVEAYRRFYVGSKARFARWTHPSTPPKWFINLMEGQDVSVFSRTR